MRGLFFGSRNNRRMFGVRKNSRRSGLLEVVDDKEQHNGAHRGGNDGADQTAGGGSHQSKQRANDDSADRADDDIADEAEASTLHDGIRQPAGHSTDRQVTIGQVTFGSLGLVCVDWTPVYKGDTGWAITEGEGISFPRGSNWGLYYVHEVTD